jgi:hypothetical protein
MTNIHAIFSGVVPDNPLKPIVRLFRHFVAFLVLCAIDATSGVFLFGSKSVLGHFELAAVVPKSRSFISLIVLLASSLLIVWVVDFFNRKVLDKWEKR